MKVHVFIDGFNVYHGLDECAATRQYRWLDYARLARQYALGKDTIEKVFYFSALCTWNKERRKRHENYVCALEATGVNVVLGKFKRKMATCRATCKETYPQLTKKNART